MDDDDWVYGWIGLCLCASIGIWAFFIITTWRMLLR